MTAFEHLEAEIARRLRIRIGLLRAEQQLDQALEQLLNVPWWKPLARARARRTLRRAFDNRTDASARHRAYLTGLPHLPLCDRCLGTGRNNGGTCPPCGGTGRLHVGGFPVSVHPDAPAGFISVDDTHGETNVARHTRTYDAHDDRARLRDPTWRPPTRPEERL